MCSAFSLCLTWLQSALGPWRSGTVRPPKRQARSLGGNFGGWGKDSFQGVSKTLRGAASEASGTMSAPDQLQEEARELRKVSKLVRSLKGWYGRIVSHWSALQRGREEVHCWKPCYPLFKPFRFMLPEDQI